MELSWIFGQKFFDKNGYSKEFTNSLESASPLEKDLWDIFMRNTDSAFESGTTLQDIIRGGPNMGITGLIYTRDCTDIFEKHEKELFEYFNVLADEFDTRIESLLGLEYSGSEGFQKNLSDEDKVSVVQTAFMEFVGALDESGFSEQCEQAFSSITEPGL